jgi:DNA (cytosine-5)-methyltransferase 1
MIFNGSKSMISDVQNPAEKILTFVDVFAGCGGLSLGLMCAEWKGLFAIEKNADAFETLRTNLISDQQRGFDWPQWLPVTPIDATSFIDLYDCHLNELQGKLDLLAGGPPCQGFSMAGRRTHADPRNALIEEYIRIVRKLKPRLLLIENVQGFMLPFKNCGDEEKRAIPYSLQVIEQLEQLDYKIFSQFVDLSNYGVPQTRKRFILVAIQKDDHALMKLNGKTPFDLLEANREEFLSSKGLSFHDPISVKEAIGDLEVGEKHLIDDDDSPIRGYQKIAYNSDCFSSHFIKLMRKDFNTVPNSMRLSKHAPETVKQFQNIMQTCSLGRTISKEDRERLGIKKHAITPLSAISPSATVTTLPDDMIHYSEPRILTVRESARLQTFPDWYEFTGNYTTGGSNRTTNCPRYTQVGNAVPPLFAEAIGRVLRELAS